MTMASKIFWNSFLGMIVLGGAGCATADSTKAPRGSASAHPAAYSQDHFTFDKEQKARSSNEFDFYYKHCSVDERKPFPTGAIWQCTFP